MWDRTADVLFHNLGTKLISAVIAIVLWVIVLGSRSVEVTKEVPLEIITASDVVTANEVPEKIAFRLSGPKAFLRAIVDRREEPIRVNLAGSKPNLVTYRFFSDNIRVPPGVKVLSITPTAILIKLEYLKKREVPLRVELRGLPPEGYRIAATEAQPAMVRLKGPESKVEGISEVATVPIDITGLTETKVFDANLQIDKSNVVVDGALPKVRVQIEPVSANFRIRNVDVRVLTNLKATVEEKTVTVLVRAEPADLKSLDRSQVFAVVDLRGKSKGKYKETPRVNLPARVGLVKVIPDKVSVDLN